MSLSVLKGDEEGLEDSIKDVENGRFSVVYATPKALLLNKRWQSMLASPLYSRRLSAVAVDEAHVIKVIPLKLFYYQTFFETWHS